MASPTIVINTADEPPANPESSHSSEPEQQEPQSALQLGQVLEAHRNLSQQYAEQGQRIEALETRLRGQEATLTGISSSLTELNQRLAIAAEPAEPEDSEDVIIPEEPEEEPEAEPAKPRGAIHKLIFG